MKQFLIFLLSIFISFHCILGQVSEPPALCGTAEFLEEKDGEGFVYRPLLDTSLTLDANTTNFAVVNLGEVLHPSHVITMRQL
jgi:hypothetical protein